MDRMLDGLMCVPAVGVWLIRRLGLRVEVSVAAGLTAAEERERLEAFKPWEGLIECVHLPYSISGRRLSLAALDDEWRKQSLDMLIQALHWAGRTGAAKAVIHTAPFRWNGEIVGEYERFVDGVRALAKEAERYRITICIENSRSYWDGCDPAASPEEIDLAALNTYLAVLPEDWLQLAKDIDRPQVKLCLDTSHATTTAQRVASLDERARMLNAYLDAGEWICHVHWSGNYLADSRGRDESHLQIYAGSITVGIRRRVHQLDATRLLGRELTGPDLIREMEFIQQIAQDMR